jgi:phage terminase large subunit-like protein
MTLISQFKVATNVFDSFRAAADLLDPPPLDGAALWYCDVPDCDGMPHDDILWRHARSSQRPPNHLNWYLWLILAGRGFGKTRTGAEWLVDKMKNQPSSYWALVAPTFDDGRDTMVEGESGLEFVLDRHKIKYEWNRSLGQLTLSNNARVDLFSSQKPDALRGPNLSGAWGDEPASWIYPVDTWDNLQLMTRKGSPQIVLTGTPKPSRFVKQLKQEADFVTTGSSYENKHNLSERWFEKVVQPLEGTRKGRQEIYAEILEDTEGALWSLDQIEFGRLALPKRFDRVVVAVDPSVSAKAADECGIVIGGRFRDHGYTVEDRSTQAAPEAWARIVVDAYNEFNADAIVAEVNNGGDLVTSMIRVLDPSVHVKTVHASRGKIPRAEPIAAMYGDPSNPETWTRATIHHAKGVDLSKMEDQMTSYVQGDSDSPDRMDANVWLHSDLFNVKPVGKGRGGLRYRK